MTVKEIINIACSLLGKTEVVEYLSGEEFSDTDKARLLKETAFMNDCVNLTINEVATEYIPVVCTEYVNNYGGMIYYSTLASKVLKVLATYDNGGNKISFSKFTEGVKTSSTVNKIEYSYIPPSYTIAETIAFDESTVPARVIAYGVASQVCVTEGRFDEAEIWHNRFVESIKNLSEPKRARIKGRCWV